MKTIRITKIFNFETAHALHGYDGKCRNIHGHSYQLWVTLKGIPIEEEGNVKRGMVLDFGDLKKIVNQHIVDVMDHAILLNKNTPHKEMGKQLIALKHRVVWTDYQPTCENMLLDFTDILKKHLPKQVSLAYLKLRETKNSYAEWYASDNL